MAEHGPEPLPIPRQIGFEFPDDLDPRWKPDDPEFCAMVNGASLTMPYLEPFLIRTVREAIPRLDDARIRDEAKAFNTQEQYHYRAHRRFNELVKAKGYPELAELEARLQASYGRLGQKSLRRRLAYTAGFEAMTMGVTRWLINNRVALFGGSDTRVASFILWHFVEEAEHKCVAYDVYQAVYGGSIAGYLARAVGVFHGALDVMFASMRGYKLILKKDGLWRQLRSRLRLARHLGSFAVTVAPYLFRAALPGHTPRREQEPQWVYDWIEQYKTAPEGYVPLVDTASDTMPVPFNHSLKSTGAAA
jgi:predicted metal-dependent hydrolase